MGIKSEEGEVPLRRASWKAIGMVMASAPTFFTKAERRVTEPTSAAIWRWIVTRRGPSERATRSITPERATAALTTSALPTIMTMSSLKPVNARSGGTMPTMTAASKAIPATRS